MAARARRQDAEAAVARNYHETPGQPKPFQHLSMHQSISEQCSIDQPTGIRQAVQLLAAKRGSLHDAHHEVMECLGEMIWASQRSGLPPDGPAYIEAVRRRAGDQARVGEQRDGHGQGRERVEQGVEPSDGVGLGRDALQACHERAAHPLHEPHRSAAQE